MQGTLKVRPEAFSCMTKISGHLKKMFPSIAQGYFLAGGKREKRANSILWAPAVAPPSQSQLESSAALVDTVFFRTLSNSLQQITVH